MKAILTIGHQDILLPDDNGLATLLKILSRGRLCHESLYLKKIDIRDEPLNLEIKLVPPKTRIVEPDQPLPLLEKTMEAHGVEVIP